MKIKYKKGRSRFYLMLVIAWFIILIVNILFVDSREWTFWIWVFLPIANIAYYSFEYFNQYLKIENGIIYRTSLFPKKLELNKIRTVRKFAGDYIIKTDQSELRIDTTIIHPDSLKELDKTLISYSPS